MIRRFKFFLVVACLLSFLFSPLVARERTEWIFADEYNGKYQLSYEKLRHEIPYIIRQIVIDLSGFLGLPFNEGWYFPLTVRFTDLNPRYAENTLAFVILYSGTDGKIRQDLNINLRAYSELKYDFETVLTHELVHAMLNDALGSQSDAVFPRWLNEGIAVYASGEGEKITKAYAEQYWGFADKKLINGLEGRHTALDYAEDFLAVKYIAEVQGSNTMQIFLKEVIERKGNVPAAYEYVAGESWEDFKKNYREFAIEYIKDIKPPRRNRRTSPY